MDSRATSLFRDFDIPVYPPSLLVAFLVLLRTISVSYPQTPAQHKELWFHCSSVEREMPSPISEGSNLCRCFPWRSLIWPGCQGALPPPQPGTGQKAKACSTYTKACPQLPPSFCFLLWLEESNGRQRSWVFRGESCLGD